MTPEKEQEPAETQREVAPPAPEMQTVERKDAAEGTSDRAIQGGRIAQGREVVDAAGKSAQQEWIGQFDKLDQHIPDNEWGASYKMIKEEFTKDPELASSQAAKALLALFALASKIASYADMMPGNFAKRVKENPVLMAEAFNNDELAGLKSANKKKTAGRLELPAAEKEKYGKLNVEAASTKYAAYSLWGLTAGMDNAAILAAKLTHSTNTAGRHYYEETNYLKIKKEGLKYGTIFIFTYDFKTADTAVAFATGNGNEVVFYHPEKGKQTLDFADKSGPLKYPALRAIYAPTEEQVTFRRAERGRDEPAKTPEEVDRVANSIYDSIVHKTPEIPANNADNGAITNARFISGELNKLKRALSHYFDKKNIDKPAARALVNAAQIYEEMTAKVLKYHENIHEKILQDIGRTSPSSSGSRSNVEALNQAKKTQIKNRIAELKRDQANAAAFLQVLEEIESK